MTCWPFAKGGWVIGRVVVGFFFWQGWGFGWCKFLRKDFQFQLRSKASNSKRRKGSSHYGKAPATFLADISHGSPDIGVSCILVQANDVSSRSHAVCMLRLQSGGREDRFLRFEWQKQTLRRLMIRWDSVKELASSQIPLPDATMTWHHQSSSTL